MDKLHSTERQFKNSLFTTIGSAGFDPEDFAIEKEDIDHGFIQEIRISYKRNPDYFFEFKPSDKNPGRRAAVFSPGEESWKECFETFTDLDIIRIFQLWLLAIKADEAVPNLWAEFVESRPATALQNAAEMTNDPFSAEEIGQIGQRLQALETTITKEFELQQQHRGFVQKELTYLSEASKRLGKKDWVLLCMGTMINLGFSLGLDGEKLNFLWQAFQDVLTNLPKLIPPS